MLLNKNRLLRELKKIYSTLEKLLDKPEKNNCKDCRYCCTEITTHGVSEIEYEYIKRELMKNNKEKKIFPFRDYINKKRDSYGKLIYTECPFYDLKEKGCSIYRVRPYSCRIFGPYSSRLLPEICNLRNNSILYKPEDFCRVLPLAKNIFKIKILYEICEAENSSIKAEKYYILALHHYYREEEEKSGEYLELAISENPDHGQSHYQMGLFHYKKGNMDGAIKEIKKALKIEPENISMKTHLGLFYMEKENYLKAKEEFEAIIKINPLSKIAVKALAELNFVNR